MKAKLCHLAPGVMELTVILPEIPTPELKNSIENKLEDYSLSFLAKDNRGLIYSAKDKDRVGVIVVSESESFPSYNVEIKITL